MLDIKFIRENKDIVAAGAKKKHIDIDIDRLLVVDDMRKELQQKIDDKRAEQNIASTAIVSAKTPEEKQAVIERMADEGFLAGVALDDADYGDGLLIAATERRTRDEIDAYAQALQKVVR